MIKAWLIALVIPLVVGISTGYYIERMGVTSDVGFIRALAAGLIVGFICDAVVMWGFSP